jgi:hypothetical protein
MKKSILSILRQEKQVIIATIFIHDSIKFLIDENNIIYHYTDRIAIGKYNISTKEIEFYFETQKEYENARKYNSVIVKRVLEN